MNTNSRILGSHVLAAALLMSLCLIATSQAQTDLAVFTGKFTLANQVLWGETILQPGDYTITIGSRSMPTFALVRDSKGRPVARFVSGIDGRKVGAGNALLIRQQRGQLRVYSLAVASLGKVLVYDPVLAREAVLEARALQTVPGNVGKTVGEAAIENTPEGLVARLRCSLTDIHPNAETKKNVPKYVIQRELPGIGGVTRDQNAGHITEVVRRSE